MFLLTGTMLLLRTMTSPSDIQAYQQAVSRQADNICLLSTRLREARVIVLHMKETGDISGIDALLPLLDYRVAIDDKTADPIV
jgi:hypothetical protein